MNPFLDQMLSQVYELEGLLLVIERHKGDTSEFIYEMVRRKVERINELAPMCVPEVLGYKSTSEDVVEIGAMMEQKDSAVEPEVEDSKLGGEPKVEENPMTNDASEDCEPIEGEYHDAFDESEDEGCELYGAVEVSDVNDTDENTCESEQPNDIVDDDSMDEDNIDVYDDLSKDDIDDCLIDEVDEVLTVDEALQRSLSKNLWKAFSLNDHFRYRRELFSNSDLEMRNTINMVEAMQSFAEAEEYFYTDLEWDAESPEVKDFMEIIRKHFL